MATKFVEGEKKYTGGVGIEVTANKVINLLLRQANNLIKVNDNNEVYTDLQMQANTQFALNNIEVGITVGRVSASDDWDFTGTVLAYKTASGTVNMWGYSDLGDLYFFDGTNWVGFYTASQVDGLLAQIRTEMETLRQQIIALIPTRTSQLTNDSGFITVAVTGLQNYYDKTTVDNLLTAKANTADVTAGLALKVDKATTYEMTNLNLNEQGVMSETFTNQALTQTLQIIKNSLSTLYDGKASAVGTQQALALKADITYVDQLVGSMLGIQTVVVDSLPAVGQGNYIYLVPISGQQGNYTKYVWDSTNRDYINLGTTSVDVSNLVTLNTAQTISAVKTYSAEPVLPANTAAATNTNTKAARESQVYTVASNLSSFQNSVSNTYATKQELEDAIEATEGAVGNGNITVQINSSTTPVTNPTFTTNQATNQVVNIAIDKNTVGLGNVDNTSDLNKPISTATQTALNAKQDTISDLAAIRAGASAGANALQSGDDISELTNDAGYLTASTGVTSFNGNTGAVTYTAPVTSVNGNTGAVTVAEFSPSNAGTTGQGLVKTASGYQYGYNVASGDSANYTVKVSSSAPASGTANTIITFVTS